MPIVKLQLDYACVHGLSFKDITVVAGYKLCKGEIATHFIPEFIQLSYSVG